MTLNRAIEQEPTPAKCDTCGGRGVVLVEERNAAGGRDVAWCEDPDEIHFNSKPCAKCGGKGYK